MRHFRTITTCCTVDLSQAPARAPAPLYMAEVLPRRSKTTSDVIATDRIEVRHLRQAAAEMQRDRIQPALVEGFGPAYEAALPLADAARLEATDDFKAGVAAGEFAAFERSPITHETARHGARQRFILIRPPA